MFIMSVDLGQAADFTAISILEVVAPTEPGRVQWEYRLRYLHRPPLGTKYTAIVEQVLQLLDQAPLSRYGTPLVVDKTGCGTAVIDMFTAAGVQPRAVTITGGDAVNKEDPFNLRVPKRELASVLVSAYQTKRLKTAGDLTLAPALIKELLNFRIKINIATGNDSYESWRESDHDDLVLSVAMALWFGDNMYWGEPQYAVAEEFKPPRGFIDERYSPGDPRRVSR